MPARIAGRATSAHRFGHQDDADFRILEVEEAGQADGVIHRQARPQQDDFDEIAREHPQHVVRTRRKEVCHDGVECAVQAGGRLPYAAFKIGI